MTLTEPDVHTYTTSEVAELVGISYRMLDYMLRNGHVTLSTTQMPGSGNYRRWTMDEVAAMVTYANRYREMLDAQEEFRNGTVWERALREAVADAA